MKNVAYKRYICMYVWLTYIKFQRQSVCCHILNRLCNGLNLIHPLTDKSTFCNKKQSLIAIVTRLSDICISLSYATTRLNSFSALLILY